MANNLVAIVRASYCMAGNNSLRVYELYRLGNTIIVDVNRSTVMCIFSCVVQLLVFNDGLNVYARVRTNHVLLFIKIPEYN